jgi:hypothetical protein
MGLIEKRTFLVLRSAVLMGDALQLVTLISRSSSLLLGRSIRVEGVNDGTFGRIMVHDVMELSVCTFVRLLSTTIGRVSRHVQRQEVQKRWKPV